MEKITESNQTQMRRGVLEYSILLILEKNDEYASSIIQKLKDVNIIVAEGTTYPLLARLKNLGMLSYRWEESLQGPPRKYYTITEIGKKQLKELDSVWEDLAGAIKKLKN
ncbi:MAG: PadR family transcriptional regulator [Bacteroidales bacterium]|nr:PadR family transcriptional regulator [Candidatus Hennigimonas equi]